MLLHCMLLFQIELSVVVELQLNTEGQKRAAPMKTISNVTNYFEEL